MRLSKACLTCVFSLTMAVVLLSGALCMAQARRPPTRATGGNQAPGTATRQRSQVILQVRRFSGLGNKNSIKTPEYKTNATRGLNPQQDWFQISVTYDTAPEWVDELTFQYFALAETRIDGKQSFSLFKTAVRYSDIEAGRSHVSTVFLHPKALKRYGELKAVAVEVLHEGKVIATDSDVGMNLPDDWWKNPLVTESAGLAVREGYLLDRSKSPFALINIDDYELIK